MKPLSATDEEESKRIFWVIQTVFGFIIGRSFYNYATILIPPFNTDILTSTIALVSAFTCVLWSWIDFSYTLIVGPYRLRNSAHERARFVTDLAIVLTYSYLFVFLDYLNKKPDGSIVPFLFALSLIYVGYAISGFLRRIQYGKRASRLGLILIYLVLFSALVFAYLFCYNKFPNSIVLVNRWFLLSTIILTISYRVIRSRLKRRAHIIAVDVDGVLANQIQGIIPIVEKEEGVKLSYNDVTSWNLPIGSTSIDKVIVREQAQRNYVVNMPLHKNANLVIDSLIKKYQIAIATARPTASDQWTKEWLSKNGISYDSYHNLKEGEKHNANLHFDILIDDYIGNVKSYLEKHTGKAILFAQPWNKDREQLQTYIQDGRLAICEEWSQIQKLVTQMLAKN